MVAHTSRTGIREQVTMKRRSCSSSSCPTSSGSDPSVSGFLAVVARKIPNSVRKSNGENSKSLDKETASFSSSNKLSDGKGKLKMSKSHVHTSKTKNDLAAAEKEESKRRFRSQDKGKEIKSSGKNNKRDQDSPRVQRSKISQKESKSRNKVVTFSPKSLDNDEDIDFSVIEQKIFEGFQAGKNSGGGKSLRKDKTKKESLRKSLPLHSKDEKRRTASKEEPAFENKKFKESSKVKDINVRKRESKDVLTTSKCSKLKGASKGKTHIMVSNAKKKKKADLIKESTDAASDSGMSDWEEVDEMEGVDEIKELLSGSQDAKAKPEGVQIELDAPDVMWGIRRRKRRTEEEMIEDYLRKSVNKSIKEVYENMHKVHLLCLFAHGRYVNQTLNSDILLGAALSVITDKNAYPPKRLDMNYLEKFISWFSRKITVKPEDMEVDYWSHPLETLLCKRFETKKAHSNRELVYMFVVICRALGMKVRVVLSLQPMSWKPSAEILIRPSKKEEKNKGPLSEPSCSQKSERFEQKCVAKSSKVKKSCYSRKMLSSESDEEVEKKKGAVTKKSKKIQGTVKKRKSLSDDEWDSDFEPNPVKIQKSRKSTGKMQRSSSSRKSTEENDNIGKRRKTEKDSELESKRRKAKPLLEWAEVYVEEEEKWICIDVTRGKIHCIAEIEVRIPAASAYITAFDANLTIKDVTRRYISSWLSSESKMRCCSKWWKKALKPFEGRKTRLDREEEEEMDQNLRQQPLPKTIAEYKNHPLYALQRHLLKFEALYPPDVSPAGFFKKEPVYPRDSVFTLCSRDTWMKEAKTVRIDEEPYKIVKARPKWDKNMCKVIKDRPLELFGEWQVEDYVPPVASGGKVPRNEYGNVELFKPSMLPGGCVHIPIAGLNRIARKLNIDCAPAMVGFDFHSGWTHPVYDGYVVCEEFKDTLLDAWNQEQMEQAKRAEEKREKRIYGNWKKLIQGILVKERVRKKYGDVSMSDEEEEWKKEEKKEVTKRKIKQEDIDAVRPTLVTHEVKNLKIDLSSNVVEMAKKSRKRTMKTKNVKRSTKKENPKRPVNVKTDLGDSESASDEEERKEKIRAILQWGDRTVASNPDLSDDSDVEKVSHPSTSAHTDQCSNPFYNSVIKPSLMKYGNVKSESRKRRKETCGQNLSGSEGSVTSASTSRSTTPEPNLESTSDLKPRRTSLRSVKRKVKTYKENEEHSEGDISNDESDHEDRSYDPKKEISLKESSKLSDLSDLE